MLYLVATPIGNLSDITFRAIDVLKNCAYILCEDTRHSKILLNHYHITTPLKSYHKFNEKASVAQVIEDLRSGQHVALISDAGTPLVSDPGLHLVQGCLEENLPVTSIPGPCAAIQALVISGLASTPFQFIGFLPKTKTAVSQVLKSVLKYEGTSICYESPQRILETLKNLESLAPQRFCVVARELTKRFEETIRGTAEELVKWFHLHDPKGEMVLLISGQTETQEDWSQFSPEEHVQFMQDTYNLSKLEAIKMVAQLRGIPKRNLYNSLHQDKERL